MHELLLILALGSHSSRVGFPGEGLAGHVPPVARGEQSTLIDGTRLYALERRRIPQRKTGVLILKEGEGHER